jgi:glucose/arabinose dehydrogenase
MQFIPHRIGNSDSQEAVVSKRLGAIVAALACISWLAAYSQDEKPHDVVTGAAAFHGFDAEHPGVFRKVTPADLPAPYATTTIQNGPELVARPPNAMPVALPGFKVQLYATGLDDPREMRIAPNGDIFLAESFPGKVTDNPPGRILVLRGLTPDGKAARVSVFATGLNRPFGIAFYPLAPIRSTCTSATPIPCSASRITTEIWWRRESPT